MLEREIGSGGMARVFLGRDEVLDRSVAVKILRHGYGGSDIGARFQREGRTAARLSHPNIVQVYDAGEADFEGKDCSYIVMEYLSGGDLKDLIDEKGPMPTEELAKLGSQVAAGLAHAHERGIIHRDIKPHNILLDERGRPKVTDFGIARALDTTQATRTGSFLGTALYSSPEQLQGEKVTPKSDVYSLGATLYQAATGEPPFTGSAISVASQHVNKPPPPPTELNSAIGAPMEALILACLAKNPDDRPSAEQVQSRLADMDEAPEDTRLYAAPPPPENTRQATQAAKPAATQAAPPRNGRPAGSRSRFRPLLAVLALLGLLALVAAIALPSLLESSGGSVGTVNQPDGGRPSDPANAPNDGGGGDQPQATTPDPEPTQPPPEETTPPEQTTQPEQPDRLSEEAAAQTVTQFYTAAADGDYGTTGNLLSSGYRASTFPNDATFQNTFDTLERIEFTEGPTPQVDGNTATVSFSTIAYHTDRTDRRTGTATLIQENGEWKIDNISV